MQRALTEKNILDRHSICRMRSRNGPIFGLLKGTSRRELGGPRRFMGVRILSGREARTIELSEVPACRPQTNFEPDGTGCDDEEVTFRLDQFDG